MANVRASDRRPGRRSALGDDAREALYQVAITCFEREGIQRTSMQKIAREAGVSRTAVNYYFSSKEALVGEVVIREAGAILHDLNASTASLRGVDRIVEATVLGIRASMSNQYVATLISPDSAAMTTTILESEAVSSLQRDFWHPLLEQAYADEALRGDIDFDTIIEWIVFLQFSITSHGRAFGMIDELAIRTRLRQFLLPALRR